MNIPPCVLRADRTVACLVDGDFVAVPGLRDVAQISAGSQATCARRVNGSVSCWGRPLGASEMEPPVDTPTAVADLTDAVDLSMGWDHACVIRRGGSVACWGAMYGGQLGDGTTVASGTARRRAWRSQRGSTRRGPDARVRGARDRRDRLLGDTRPQSDRSTGDYAAADRAPRRVGADLKSGYASTCALTTGGAVLCRGANSYGQLGDGTRVDRATPVAVAGLDDAIAIAPGTLLTCALRRTLAVECWGYRFGNGDGRDNPRAAVTRVISSQRLRPSTLRGSGAPLRHQGVSRAHLKPTLELRPSNPNAPCAAEPRLPTPSPPHQPPRATRSPFIAERSMQIGSVGPLLIQHPGGVLRYGSHASATSSQMLPARS